MRLRAGSRELGSWVQAPALREKQVHDTQRILYILLDTAHYRALGFFFFFQLSVGVRGTTGNKAITSAHTGFSCFKALSYLG